MTSTGPISPPPPRPRPGVTRVENFAHGTMTQERCAKLVIRGQGIGAKLVAAAERTLREPRIALPSRGSPTESDLALAAKRSTN